MFIYTLVNIWTGSKPFIKVVLKPKCVLVLGQLWWTFLIHFKCWLLYIIWKNAETVLLCHHWIRPLHVNNCLVQLSNQIWPQKTSEGSPDCWANHWYNPPYSPRIVLIQSEQKGWQNHSGPLTSSTLPLWTVTVWLTLQSSEHQNDQTQEQFLPPSNPSHEHLTLNVEHTTLLYIINHHTYFSFLFAHIRPVLYTHNCLYYILCFCYFDNEISHEAWQQYNIPLFQSFMVALCALIHMLMENSTQYTVCNLLLRTQYSSLVLHFKYSQCAVCGQLNYSVGCYIIMWLISQCSNFAFNFRTKSWDSYFANVKVFS